ncbi:unnamed protein product [marine sediment metagenome]|uniref:JAB domain-containing protein n=1 Tax=marine sediment metagenome TaxID=412755 RepID=X0ZIJ0_9ZZZZ
MKKEICYIMLGKQGAYFIGDVYRGRLVKKVTGKPALVEFDGQWVLDREEKKGDILGFWHTHPDGTLKPSERDLRTMQAWISCFDKPLFCVIQNTSRETAYLVSSIKHKKWQAVWSKKPFVYKIFRHFGVYS